MAQETLEKQATLTLTNDRSAHVGIDLEMTSAPMFLPGSNGDLVERNPTIYTQEQALVNWFQNVKKAGVFVYEDTAYNVDHIVKIQLME